MKKTILFYFSGCAVFIIVMTVLTGYPSLRWQDAFRGQVEAAEQPGGQQQSASDEMQQLRDQVNNLTEKNSILTNDYKNLLKDRDNLMIQTKRLVDENKQFVGLQDTSKNFEAEKATMKNALDNLEKSNRLLKEELEATKAEASQASQEKAQLQKVLLQLQTVAQKPAQVKKSELSSKVKQQVQKLDTLKKENANLLEELKRSGKRIEILESSKGKIKETMDDLQARLASAQQKISQLQKENEVLAEEARGFPQKFTELARQNKALLKETADMHYNLGVFYVKGKEYKRAIKEFEKVLDLEPTEADAYYNLGYIYAEQVIDRPKSLSCFRNYLKYTPDAKDADWVKKYLITWETMQGKRSTD